MGIIILGLIALYGLNYWQEKKNGSNGNNIVSRQKADEIVITDLPTGEKLVENKTQGYSVRVPNTWQIEKPTSNQTPISFYTDGLKCKMTSSVQEAVRNFEELESKLKNEHSEWYTINQDKFLITEINNNKVLKNLLDTVEGGYSVSIYLLRDKLYIFSVMNESKDKEFCSQEFDKFLATISIK
jgi:hypothetical protein